MGVWVGLQQGLAVFSVGVWQCGSSTPPRASATCPNWPKCGSAPRAARTEGAPQHPGPGATAPPRRIFTNRLPPLFVGSKKWGRIRNELSQRSGMSLRPDCHIAHKVAGSSQAGGPGGQQVHLLFLQLAARM